MSARRCRRRTRDRASGEGVREGSAIELQSDSYARGLRTMLRDVRALPHALA